jgi:hypothetical protein
VQLYGAFEVVGDFRTESFLNQQAQNFLPILFQKTQKALVRHGRLPNRTEIGSILV